MYSQANKDSLPYFGWWDGAPVNWATYTYEYQFWVAAIARYVGNQTALYVCPSDDEPIQDVEVVREQGTIYMPPVGGRGTPLDISYRGGCDLIDGSDGTYKPRKMTSWKFPARALMMVEGKSLGVNNGQIDANVNKECVRFMDDLAELIAPSIRRGMHPNLPTWSRHSGKSNVPFLDGHVDRLAPKQLGRMAKLQEHYLDPSEDGS
jgi:prepilin-type processing-associated H-X9-DG protein